MKIAIESTGELTTMDGVLVRHWTGVTERGVRCHVFVRSVAVSDQADSAEFDAELARANEPTDMREGEVGTQPGSVIPMRMLM
jgi:hypothetical protein